MSSWTDKKIVQLLLHVIDEKVQGPPNYERIGEIFGVSGNAVKIKYNNLRKDFRESAAKGGNITPQTTPKKRTAATSTMSDTKEVKGDVKSKVAAEAGEKLESAKRVKSSRNAAGKAKEKIKEEYEQMQNFITFEEE